MLARIVVGMVAGLILAGPGQAADERESGGDGAARNYQFSVGVLHWGTLSPLEGTGKEPDTGVVPWLAFRNDWLAVDPAGLAVKLHDGQRLAIEGIAAPRWVMADPQDSVVHADLRRRTSVDLGVRFSAALGPATASLEYLADVTGRVGGHEIIAEAAIGTGLPAGGQLGIKAGASWRDDDLNTWEFGVLPGEERPDRPEWSVGADFIPHVGLMVSYPLAGRLEATLAAEAQWLRGGMADSPIISRRWVPSAFIGLLYTFGAR
jgi:outer membrane protein